MLKKFLKNKLSRKSKKKLRDFYNDLRATLHVDDLSTLGAIYGTDKIAPHEYTTHYNTHFRPFKRKRTNLLEIGVGGYSNPKAGGESLRMWKKYFPYGKINAIDIYDKSYHQENRIKIFEGSQVDKPFLDKVLNEVGELDIIIDDGSHINEHIIESFKYLFPKLKSGGIYVVEDIQTSYWDDGRHGGDSKDFNNPKTAMCFFRRLVDGLNFKEFVIPGYKPTYYDKNILSMHFYHNMVFIYKGENKGESNRVVNNEYIVTPNEKKQMLKEGSI